MSTVFFIFSLVLSLTFQPGLFAADPKGNGSNQISRACEHSPHKEFCLSVFQADPASTNADIKGLATIALKLAVKNTTEISVRVKSLLSDGTLEPGVQEDIYDCNKQYLDAVAQIDHAVVGFNMNDYQNVETWMKTAATQILTCQNKVKDMKSGVALELSKKSHAAHQLINTALGVVHAVAH
ncbi:pectinesterase inhibitor-like [Cornus florida]|uniref:pectinesterase inhibitor-like n=1 Tax=Cornus florida TaxID=4283 RepID=UPI0028993C81|nr:pectinesterase inhibitor-like [Cornus florida]